MNDSSLLSRYANHLRPEPANDTADPADESDDCGAFGWLRGINSRSLMLELRKKDGSVRAFGYAWLSEVEYDPSAGITLCFGGRKLRLVGRNLDAEVRPNVRLLAGLLRHRVPWVQEADEGRLMTEAAGQAVVERIEW